MLKISDLQPMIPYRITKKSSDHTFLIDDVIWISENGDMKCVE